MNNPTIVSAALSDKELQDSINRMVANFDKGLQDMLDHSNKYVEKIQKSLQKIGDTDFGAKGSNDGGIAKQTKAQKEATNETERRLKKEKEVNLTLDQRAEIMGRIPREMRMPDMTKSARESFQAFYKGFNEQARQLEPLIQSWERLLQSRHTGNIEQVAQQIRNVKSEIAAIVREQANLSRTKPQGYLEEIGKRNVQIKSLRDQLVSLEAEQQKLKATDPFKDNPYLDRLRAKHEELANAMRLSTDATYRLKQATAEELEIQRKRAEESVKSFYTHTMKMPTDQYDVQIAKLENIRALLQRIRSGETNFFTTTQVTGLEKEERRLVELIGQVNTEQQQATQSAQRYTEEIRKQAQAIRESKQWKETGTYSYRIGYETYYISKKQGEIEAQLVRHKEQQVNYQKDYLTAGMAVEQNTKQQASTEEKLVQAEQQRLGIEQQITQEKEKQKKKYTSPTSNEWVYNQSLYNNFVKSRLGGKTPVSWKENTSDINTLNAALSQLRKVYSSLTSEERAHPYGQSTLDQIQRLERRLNVLRSEMSRPVSFNAAMGLSEKTLDDIAYKMQRLRAYKQGIDLTKPNATNEIKQVDEALAKLQKDADKWIGKSNEMIKSNTALGRSWNYMKNRLAFYFTVGASTSFIKNLIEVRSQYEMNERALGILVNSAERGTQIFNELSQMALVSPYTLIELSAAAKQLTAYDVAAKDVVDTTRRLADMAAAVGIPIERLTYALGQIKAYGYLNARDARMFANAGIPLVKQLSEYYTELEGRLVSTADIYDRIKKKSIGYEEVTSVIAKMTDEGGKFYDFQAKMAETLKVQLANLTLAWNNMLNAMGEESQGVLVGGISTLKQVFLHWKDIEHVLYELVVALGAYKAYQIITTRLMGETAASLDAQVLAMKRNKAAMLEKQALTRKLTADEISQVNAQKMVTAADYQNALSGKQLTKQKALLLVALNKNNAQLKTAVVNMGLLTTQEVANITTGKALAIVFKSIEISIRNAALAVKAFMASMWPLLVIGAIYELYHAWDSYGEHVKEINKQAAEHAKEAFDNIRQYLESDVTSALQDRLAKGGKVESDAEGQKAWDEMREKIELSSSASNAFIAKLMQINDINERLSAGFGYLDDIQKVAGVMQTLEEDAVNTSSTVLGGLFGEGLKDDLQDFLESKDAVISAYGDIGKAAEELKKQQESANVGIGSVLYDMQEFAKEVKKTTDSIYDIASREGFNTNQQREFFEREISEIAQAEQMGAKETRIFRIKAEEEYFKRSMEYLNLRLKAQKDAGEAAMAAETEARIKEFKEQFGANKAIQESFFTWLTEKQDHAVKNMLRGKTQEEIKQGEWLKGSNAKWVEEMARKFSKEYGVSFDDLHRLVLNANTWSINIPVFFQTIGQPLSDIQRDYEARTGKKFSSNPLIKDAKTQVDIIDTLKKKQKEVANEMETARKAGGKYWEDNKQRYKEENDALVADIHAYNALTDAEEKANKKKGKGSKKDPLLDALKQEISLVEKLQSDYDKLSKGGASQSDALETIRGAYGKTIRLLNAQLGRYGLPQIDISQMITGKDPNKALAHFKQTLDTLVRKGMLTLERSKELEAVVEKFTLSAKTYNLDMITKGLNNELGKLKDEYELAVAIDADPELGNAFADMMGINVESLPHTVKEYADEYSKYLNKYLKGKNSSLQFTGDELRGLTRDDINALQSQVDAGTFNQEWFDVIKKAYEDVSGKRKKDLEETEKWKNSLIEKYGNLQDKLTKIYKDGVQNQVNAVKTFGTEDQKSEIVRLQLRLEETDNPAELTEINTEIAKIVKDVTDKNPIALKLVTASDNQTKSDVSKAYWEDFKNSDMYTMTFEDMANNSTRAIELIIDKLNSLKDHVKEDPASMKALVKSLEDAEKELNARDPFGGIARSLKNMEEASKETKDAQEALWRAEVDVEQAQQAYDNAEDGTPEEREAAQKALASAIQKRTDAQNNLTKAENKGKKAQENLKSSLQGVTGQLGNVKSLFDTVSSLFRAGGDDETADAIDAISQGFSIMTTVIMGVVAAMILLKSSNPELLAIAAALSVIVGLVSFLSGNENKKIDEEIKESELAVKRLENQYKKLQAAVEDAYGTMAYAAEKAAVANKKLQLEEMKRQLRLEQSRDSKDRDDDKIESLRGQIIDLEREIQKATDNWINDMLGISSVGDAAEQLVSSMIDAFRQGEDYMGKFYDSFDEMIENMIMKAIATKVIGEYIESMWNDIKSKAEARSKKEAQDVEETQSKYNEAQNSYDAWVGAEGVRALTGDKLYEEELKRRKDMLKKAEEEKEKALKEYEKAITPTPSDVEGMREDAKAKSDFIKEWFDATMKEWGIAFGDKSNKNLSNLQQGIQGITEDTAGALEAITNGISQQSYLQSDLLTQIRDTILGFDLDIQMGVLSEILLQLQSSYQIQMSIRDTLQGWSNASGMAVRVEMV